MRVGVTLPQFRHDAAPAIAVAKRVEEVGLDGVFVFDHFWPLGHPDRPALHWMPLLGAVAAETTSVTVGTLVARVGLVPNPVLVNALQSVGRIAGGRLVAGLGTGDGANRVENVAYGLAFGTVKERLAMLSDACRRLRAAGVRTWVGGLGPDVRRLAAAEADGWNAWGASVDDLVRHCLEFGPPSPDWELTWAGPVLVARTEQEAEANRVRHTDRPELVQGTVEQVRRHFADLADAGVAWAVCSVVDAQGPGENGGRAPWDAVEMLAEAAKDAG